MVEYDERERFLDSIGPELAHVMVIAVVEKVNCGNVRGIAAFLDNAFTFCPIATFGVVDQFIDFLDGVIITVTVGADDFRAVEPANIFACLGCVAQSLHKGLFGVNSRKILNRDFHVLIITKN